MKDKLDFLDGIKDSVYQGIKSKVDDGFTDLGFVSYDQFKVQEKMLDRNRKKIDYLEKELELLKELLKHK